MRPAEWPPTCNSLHCEYSYYLTTSTTLGSDGVMLRQHWNDHVRIAFSHINEERRVSSVVGEPEHGGFGFPCGLQAWLHLKLTGEMSNGLEVILSLLLCSPAYHPLPVCTLLPSLGTQDTRSCDFPRYSVFLCSRTWSHLIESRWPQCTSHGPFVISLGLAARGVKGSFLNHIPQG